jgi:hypothetical protein
MSGGVRAVLLLLGGTALVAAGCARRPAPPARPILVDVQIVDRTPAGGPARVDVGRLREEVLRIHREAGIFAAALGRAPQPGEEPWRMRLELGLDEDARDGRGLARAAVVIRLEPIGGPPDAPRLETQGGAEQPYALAAPDINAVYARLVGQLTSDLLRGLLARARLRKADVPTLVAAIGSAELEVRLGAIAAAAERRERGAVPALIERLGDSEELVRDRTLGALIEIGDRRAVKPLVAQTRFQDLDTMHKIIEAVASLGGDEARSYLELVASGHEDREVRDQAREALDRLRRKEQAAARP